jgi:asparagine synthase (glutamine-hydrolysing)
MCGIAGLLHHRLPVAEAEALVRKSLEAISHRGDPRFQQEVWSAPGFYAGANRLPFTSGSEPQPAQDASGTLTLFLNGEIFSLHAGYEVSRLGWSDTRAFVESMAREGVRAAVHRCEGMYAAMAIDSAAERAWLTRDPIGIKPLYFAKCDFGTMVASEIKALSVHDFVHQIEHVSPGSLLEVTPLGTVEVTPRKTWKRETTPGPLEPEGLRDALLRSVEEQTRDGQQYAVYLSGGLDSGAVYASARALGRPVVPIVLGTTAASDVAAARWLTDHFGDVLKIVECPKEDALVEVLDDVVRCAESFEPNVVRQSAVTGILASAAAAEGFTVALCGEGADELFGGYPEFWTGDLPFANVRERFLSDLHRTQLQRVDRMNMASTIEVRVPFLARAVAELALSSEDPETFGGTEPSAEAKRPLRDAMKGILPDPIRLRPKVVLSEGAGLRGNAPLGGMFCENFPQLISPEEAGAILEAYAEWNISTAEEAFYFRLFRSFGYDRYRAAKTRVFANGIHTACNQEH